MSKKSESKEILEIVTNIAKDYENILKIMKDVNSRTEGILSRIETIHKLLLEYKPQNPELEDKVNEINDKVSYAIDQIGKLKTMVYHHRRITEKRNQGYNPRYNSSYKGYSKRYTRRQSKSGDNNDGEKSKR